MLRTVLALGLALTAAAWAEPSDSTAARPDSSWRNQAPRLYIQDETYADVDYIRTEITFVNYVRDPKEADIHLIISSSTTGCGGSEYTLDFKGLGAFKDMSFALRHNTKADVTSDESRTALVAAIKRGLAPYVARTGLRDMLSVDFTPPTSATPVADPWRNWVFALSANGYGQAERSWMTLSGYGNADISRVTEDAKLDISGYVSITHNRYDMGDSWLTVAKESYGSSAFYARKLSNHFSVGGEVDYFNSRYSNVAIGLSAVPKVEYCLTRYPEYARHKVYLRFQPGVSYQRYYDTTLDDKLNAFLVQNELRAGVTATRRWGTVDLSVTGSHYLHDLSKNRLTLSGSATLRIVAGLSLNVGGYYALIHDQLSLRKGDATEEERLLRIRELGTGYTYYGWIGLTYTFGSIYNNIVNPIF
jgi:hypothetical protein